MINGLFQPMHLLLLLLFLIGCLSLVLLLIVIMLLRKTSRTPAGLAVEDRLARLAALKEKVLISDDEYQAKRQQLLDEL